MRQIKALLFAFFSPGQYRETFYRWKGIGILLLLMISLVETLVLVVTMTSALLSTSKDVAPGFTSQIPEIQFKDGVASTPEERSYEIIEPNSGDLIAIIDTRTERPPADLGEAQLYVAQKSLSYKNSDVETRSYDFAEIEDFMINDEKAALWFDLFARWFGPVAAPFIFVFIVIWHMVQWLFFSLFVLLAKLIFEVQGSFAAALRISALAMVPPTLFFAIPVMKFPFSGFVYCLVVIGYVFLGIHACREKRTAPTPPPIPQ